MPSMKAIAKLGAKRGGRRSKSHALARDRGEDGIVPKEKLRDCAVGTLIDLVLRSPLP